MIDSPLRSQLTTPAGAALLGAVCLAALVAGAQGQEPPGIKPALRQVFTYHHDNILGTALDLTVIATSRDAADAAEKSVLAEVERLRLILSSYDPEAELGKLNALGSRDEPMKVSPELIEVLKQYDYWTKQSRNAYTGQMGRLIEIWKSAEKDKKLPVDAELLAAAQEAARPAWQIDEAKGTVKRLFGEQINIDSLGKGYIVGKAVAAATKDAPALSGMLLNIGGDLRVWGTPPPNAGQFWAIGVQDPAKPALNAAPLSTVRVPGDRAVASSGGYQRFYTIGGKRYSHILDARTGKPARNLGATVVAPDSATANALATMCCILKTADAFELVRAVPGADCLIVTAEGTVLRSNGFKLLEGANPPVASPPVVTTPAPGSTATEPKAGAAWPKGFSVSIDLETVQTRHKPYVIVWVTDSAGRHVKTLGAWGNETKYLKEMREWWKFAQKDRALQSMTHATQRAGKYPLTWDGTDQKGDPVPTGKYSICVEVAAEKGPHSAKWTTINCGPAEAAATIASSAAFNDVAITYGPADKR